MKKSKKIILSEEQAGIDIPDDKIIQDIQRIARILNTNKIDIDEYLKNGGKIPREIIDDEDYNGFSAWCQLAGLKSK